MSCNVVETITTVRPIKKRKSMEEMMTCIKKTTSTDSQYRLILIHDFHYPLTSWLPNQHNFVNISVSSKELPDQVNIKVFQRRLCTDQVSLGPPTMNTNNIILLGEAALLCCRCRPTRLKQR